MKLTYVIITRNRRERLLKTLQRLMDNTPLDAGQWETFVVDNASDDDTVAAVRSTFPGVHIIPLAENQGMSARNHAFAQARGQYLFSLDDDSYPDDRAVNIALAYMAAHPRTAALVARAVLPNGKWESSALPGVMLGGAVVLRRSVIAQIGGFPPEFFRQAEEYDLSFRIWQAGYSVDRCEEMVFRHDKSPGGRSSAITHKMDLRNNLILIDRYLPRELRTAYRHDWIRRYAALAEQDHCGAAITDALGEARNWAARERTAGRRTLPPMLVEKLFGLEHQGDLLRRWKREHGIHRVVIADFSKNLFATWRACQLAGLDTVALADDRSAFKGKVHRRMPILTTDEAIREGADGIVLSNINPAQIDDRHADLRSAFAGPILRLWEPRRTQLPQSRAA